MDKPNLETAKEAIQPKNLGKLLPKLLPFLEKIKDPGPGKLLADLMKKVTEWIAKLPEIMAKIPEMLKAELQKTPDSIEQYVKIGNRYVAKRLILILTVGALFAGTVAVKHPWIDSRFGSYEIVHEVANQSVTYTGRAQLYDTNNVLRYQGDMTKGQYNGSGQLYNAAGVLIYDGDFKEGKKVGSGSLYDDAGTLLYKGQFADDVYAGTGTLYYGNKQAKYSGSFASGVYSGKGTAYFTDGKIQYDGNFLNGVYEGDGKLFNTKGAMIYSGNFAAGRYDGAGKQFDDNGKQLYEGAFKAGVYSGTGTLYYTSGLVKYAGEFAAGLYNGTGKFLNENGVTIYSGTFENGFYSGSGVLNDDAGNLLYKGTFKSGLKDGLGELYNTKALIVYKGYFKQDHIYPQGFWGLSQKQVQAELGDPSSTTAATPSSLATLTYADYKLTLTLGPNPDNPKETVVTQVEVWGDPALSSMQDLIDHPISKADGTTPLLNQIHAVNNPDGSKMVAYETSDNFLMICYYNNTDHKLSRVVFLAAPKPPSTDAKK